MSEQTEGRLFSEMGLESDAAMAMYIEDELGPFLDGCFYQIDNSLAMASRPMRPGSIEIAAPADEEFFAYATVVKSHYNTIRTCPSNPEHVTEKLLQGLDLDLYGGPIAPAVPNLDYLLLRDDMAKKLRKSGLSGFEIVPVRIHDDQSGGGAAIEAISFRGPNIQRKRKLIPAAGNRCHYCGYEPVICPSCENADSPCPRCGQKCVDYGKQDRPDRIIITPIPEAGVVVSGAAWDGADFCSGRSADIASRRAVTFFQRMGLGPLVAEPLRTYVGDCNEAQLERLHRLRDSET